MYCSIESASSSIERIWMGDSTVEPTVGHRSDPVLGVDVVFQFGGDSCRVLLQGPVTRRRTYPWMPDREYVGIRFRPGLIDLSGPVAWHELTDEAVELDRLAGVDLAALGEQLVAEPGLGNRGRHAFQVAASGPFGRLSRSRVVAAALARFEAVPGEPVSRVARWLGWTERSLQRRFRADLGISPKHAARLVRVSRVQATIAAAARPHEIDLAALAVSSGYCDQAHLSGEIGRVLGVSPSVLVAEQRRAAGR